MAAHDYYNTHPTTSTHLHPDSFSQSGQTPTLTIKNPASVPPIMMPLPNHPTSNLSPSSFSTSPSNLTSSHHKPSPSNLALTLPTSGYASDASTTNRGFFLSSINEESGRKQIESDRTIDFVEKQVEKQIEKKLNGHGGGGGGHGQQFQEQMNQAFGVGEQGAGAGAGEGGGGGEDYGYAASNGGAGGNCGYGTSSDYAPPEGDFGAGFGEVGSFELGGAGGEVAGGWLGELVAGLGEA